jgi:hypothetical protein
MQNERYKIQNVKDKKEFKAGIFQKAASQMSQCAKGVV